MTAPEEPTDAHLVERARAGSRPSFEALVRRYQRPLYFLCLRYVRDHDAASDLAQRTLIKALEKMDELRDPGIFKSWLFRIGANLALNHLRDNARFVEEQAPSGPDEPLLPEAEAQLEAAEDAAALRRAVAELPTKQRMTLELRVFEELSFRDIAESLETTEGAAKVNFHYAVRRLRALLVKAKTGLGKVGK
ncbi:MAG TPA: sigma-70 family RNA polymerase sigma factor [Polyangia bacterium]|nr:sigma-70 family RNA polymerase sigma factor [Polyangia bacterium]